MILVWWTILRTERLLATGALHSEWLASYREVMKICGRKEYNLIIWNDGVFRLQDPNRSWMPDDTDYTTIFRLPQPWDFPKKPWGTPLIIPRFSRNLLILLFYSSVILKRLYETLYQDKIIRLYIDPTRPLLLSLEKGTRLPTKARFQYYLQEGQNMQPVFRIWRKFPHRMYPELSTGVLATLRSTTLCTIIFSGNDVILPN